MITLNDFFEQHPKVALCFSGGVDSSYLLYAAKKLGAEVKPYFLKTSFQPEFELEDAQKLAQSLGFELRVLEGDPLSQPSIAENSPLRCYHCKSYGLGLIAAIARQEGFATVVDGSNWDDDPSQRPGMKALEELGILSPLRLAHLTKEEIRLLSKEASLFTWDKAAYSCLATRIPTGTPLNQSTLEKVEASEKFLFSLGFTDFRVRVFGAAAKVQLPESQMEKFLSLRPQILEGISFEIVLMDLQPRV